MKKYYNRNSITEEFLSAQGLTNEIVSYFDIPQIDYQDNTKANFYPHCMGYTNPDSKYHIYRKRSRVNIISQVLDGEGYILYNDKTYHVKKGDAYLLLQGIKVEYFSSEDNPLKTAWVNIVSNQFSVLLDLYGIQNNIVFENINIMDEIKRIFALEKISTISSEISNQCLLIVNEILYKLSKPVTLLQSKSELTIKIKLHLERGIYTIKKLSEVSDFFGVNESYIITIFKKEFGITPYQYLQQLRIEKAKELLRNTKKPISIISDSLCFYDPYIFSKTFKNRVGVSPMRYRRNSEN